MRTILYVLLVGILDSSERKKKKIYIYPLTLGMQKLIIRVRVINSLLIL